MCLCPLKLETGYRSEYEARRRAGGRGEVLGRGSVGEGKCRVGEVNSRGSVGGTEVLESGSVGEGKCRGGEV